MANKVTVAQRGLDMMKGVYEWWQGQEMGEDVSYALNITRTKRKGVFRLDLNVFDNRRGQDLQPVVKYAREWPDSQHQSLEGCIMAMTLQVDRMMADWVLDQQKPMRDP